MLCDHGSRYQSKLFNPVFLKEKGLPIPAWLSEQDPVPAVFADISDDSQDTK
jgi:cysteine synthase A